MKKTNDWQAKIQQLVDGECDHAQRTRLLQSLPAQSPIWRDLSLAFVERQILDESLGDDRVVERDEQSPAQSIDSQLSRLIADDRSGDVAEVVHRGRSNRNAVVFWTALAGCLALGLVLGEIHGRRPGGESSKETEIAMNDEVGPRSPMQPALADEGIPLADALSRASFPIPVDFRRALMKQGYLITELDRPSKVRLPTGQVVEIPLRQVAVTYLGNETYQ